MDPLTIPTHLDELTPEWLTAALGVVGILDQGAVKHVSAALLSEGRGFTGQVVRLQLDYDDAAPAAPRSLVAKLPAADFTLRKALHDLGLYAREFSFYQDVAPAAAPAPRLYYAALDPEIPATVLLLEDLSAGRVGDNLRGCTEDDAVLAVTELARFHARWWDQPGLATLPLLAPVDHEWFAQVCQQQWDPFRARLAGRLPARLETLGAKVLEHLADYHRWFTSAPVCIVHGDFRLDNLVFIDGGAVRGLAIIDWQVASRARGVTDIAYFAAFCLPVEIRRRIERDLVRHYHDALVAGGVAGYAAAQCWDDYRLATLSALVRLIGAIGVLDFSSERGVLLAEVLIERTDAVLADHNAAALLDRSFPVPERAMRKGATR